MAHDMNTAGSDLATTVAATRPLVSTLTRNRDAVFDYIRYWALTTNGYDGLSHYFRVSASLNPATLTGLLPTAKGLSTQGPTPAGTLPRKKNSLAGILNSAGGLLGGSLLVTPSSNTSDGPTGLNQSQESNLLGFLFGGS